LGFNPDKCGTEITGEIKNYFLPVSEPGVSSYLASAPLRRP
jgi:hypothetical protein